MKKTYFSFFAILLTAQIVLSQSSYLTPDPAFHAQDVLPDQDTFSCFEVSNGQLTANDGNTVYIYSLQTWEVLQQYSTPSDYSGHPEFVRQSPDGQTIWAGFSTSNNTDDRIYTLDISTGNWDMVAAFPALMDLQFWGDHILVSGLNSTNWGTPNGIFLLDTTDTNNHRKIIETGGSSAGFSTDSQGNIYFATSFFTSGNALHKWNSDDVAETILNEDAAFLTPTEATKLSDLAAAAFSCHVDAAGNLIFNLNDFSSDKVLAIWNQTTGSGFHYDTLATASDNMDWLTHISSEGNVLLAEPGNAVYTLAWGRPVARVYKKNPPIVVNPIANIMARENDSNVVVDLSGVFYHEGYDNDYSYGIATNSFPEVASAILEGDQLEINFLTPGQTHITISVLSHGTSATHSFAVGVQPHITGEYVIADFENLELEPNSYWNGLDQSGGFSSGLLFFPNLYNPEWGSWMHWAYSNMSDNTTPGWTNQFSAITGKGIQPEESGGSNYAVAFEPESLVFDNPSAHQVKGLFITNSTYAALSMKHGDDFSKKFGGEDGNDPDWFKLTIQGMRNGQQTGEVDFYLADYRFENNSQNYIVETWQWIELSSLGKIDSLMFTMSSSDVGDWGMNTPAFFCVDNVYVVPDLPPYAINPLEDILLQENTEDHTLDISQVFTDPDDDDTQIIIHLMENTNPDLVAVSINQHNLTLSVTPETNGSALITLEALSNGKTATESFTVTVEPAGNVVALNTSPLHIYPNPTSGVINIVSLNLDYSTQVALYNLSGQRVYQKTVYNGDKAIDLSGLPAGNYILRVTTPFTTQTARVVKQ